jgi:alkylhydroperoxidase family enzyme
VAGPAATSAFYAAAFGLDAPDGTIWKVATESKKDTSQATRHIEGVAILLGVADMTSPESTRTGQHLARASSQSSAASVHASDILVVRDVLAEEHHMARIPGMPARQAGPYVRLVYYFTRRSISRLTGRTPEGMLQPIEMYAHIPGLLRGYAGLEQATAKLHHLSKRLRALAELKTATVVQCEYCIDLGSQVSRQWGLSDEELLALPSYRSSALFSDLDKLVLDYAVGLSRTPVDVPDALFAELRAHLDEAQLVELTHVIALENLRGRFNLAMGIGAAGFSEGMICAVPATLTADEPRSR